MKRKFCLFSIVLLMIVSCFALCACGSDKTTLTINFDSNGGTECKSIAYEIGKSFDMPDDPTKENFIFDGWYCDNGVWQEEFTINTLLNYPLSNNSKITVYAKWIEKSKFIFESNGGSECESFYLENTSTTLPTPTFEGYIFKGWYLDNTTFQNKYQIGNHVETDNNEIILYAKWEKIIKKTIYYKSNQFTLEKEYDIISNYEEIDLYKPSIFGYSFAGWFYDENFEEQAPNKISHSMINTYNNAITLHAKFTEKDIHKISLVGQVKSVYEYGEEFDANGAKIKIEYVDKNFDDEIVDITKDMVTSFYTIDNRGYAFQITESGIKDEAYINVKEQSVKFEYFVNSDITSFSVIDTSELEFTHGGNTDFRNKNIKIAWTDKNNNSGETKLTEFSDYTINYKIEEKKNAGSSIPILSLSPIQLEFELIGPVLSFKTNSLNVSNYGTFTAQLRYHFKTIEVEYTVLPNENITKGKCSNNIYLNYNHSLTRSDIWVYDSELKDYIKWNINDYSNLIVKDIDTSIKGYQKAIMFYNGKEIEIDCYVIDFYDVQSAKVVNNIRQYENYSSYEIEFTLSDGYKFSERAYTEYLINFSTSEIGSFSCLCTQFIKEITITYVVVAK